MATASAYTLDTGNDTYALMVALSSKLDRGEACDYCELPATLGVATGADPVTVPCCYRHASELVTASLALAAQLAGITTGGGEE